MHETTQPETNEKAPEEISDPVEADPRKAEDPSALVRSIGERIRELRYRIAARDQQWRVKELEAELAQSAAEAAALAKARRASGPKPPANAEEAKEALCRLLARCEKGFNLILGEETEQFESEMNLGTAAQIANAAANLARAIDVIDMSLAGRALEKENENEQGAPGEAARS